jgi:hypothetical protein
MNTNTNTNTNMNSRIINTFPWGLYLNHNFDTTNSAYKYTGKNSDEPDKGKSKRLKLFDTNVPELIPMDVVEEEEEEEVGLVKQQRQLPPLILDTDSESEEEDEVIHDTVLTRQTTFWNDADIDIDIPEMPVLRRQTTSWVNKNGFTVYNGCPFGNRLINNK